MFRVSFFCEDKHLAPIMHGLSGVTRDLQVTPVVNAVSAANGKLKQVAGSTIELMVKDLHKRGVSTFTPDLMRSVVQKAGQSPKSWNYFIKQMKAAGIITVAGKGSKVLYSMVKS